MHFLTPGFLKLSVTIAAQLLLMASWYFLAQADSPNRQPWIHVDGNCASGLEGAVFAISGANCGGNSTSFDTRQIYSPVVLKDVTSDAAPCSGIPNGAICWRMWYVGEDAGGRPRIGYAVSADGLSWSRVPGSRTGGSVFDVGPVGNFDSEGVTYFTIMKDGSIFKMWYSGYGSTFGLTLTEGIGHATSTDGLTWTRVPGSLAGGAVLRASGTSGAFDQQEAYVPYVLKDQATVQAPCTGIPTGQTCYRMWYEGATNTSDGYHFLIGYATSADGMNWTRVPGGGSGGEVLGAGPFGNFDDNSVGIPIVIKEGAFYRMWYEAKDFASGKFTIGHVVSVDGVSWVRPSSNQPVYKGSDDPATAFNPDHIWSHTVLKDGSTYRMWYTLSTKPNARRFGHAIMTPGASLGALSMVQTSNNYTVSFTSTVTISATGSILLTLPPDIPFEQVTAGTLSGFGLGATLLAEPAAVSDAPAANTTRGALLIRLTADELAGPKTVGFSLTSPLATAGPLLVQTFDTREVLEYGMVNLPSPALHLTISDETVIEGDIGTGNAIFMVMLSKTSQLTATVAYTTANNTAIVPSDYLTATGILTFTPGVTLQTIIVSVQGDTVDELDETYLINLSNPINATLDDGQGQGTIIDNDISDRPPDAKIYLPLIFKSKI